MTNWTESAGLAVCNIAWLFSCLPGYFAFQAGRDHVASVQMRKLASLLRRNAGTEFGSRWRFGCIRGYEDWRDALPVQEYEDFAPYIDRIKSGGQNLLTSERVLLLEPTSGSSGTSKLIPYTQGLRREFQQAISAWVADIFLGMPSLLCGRSYWSVSPPVQQPDAAGSTVKIGFDDDSQYLGRIGRSLMRRILAVPQDFDHAGEFLASCRGLSFISVWSPTFLDSLFQRDFQRTRGMGSVRFVSAWGDGASAQFTPLVGKYFPQALFQPKGLVSTECFSSFPLFATGHRAVLAYRSHFFEFMDGAGRLHPVQELQQGGQYTLVASTSGGLYRYNTHDRVEVTGFHHAIPLLKFCCRDNHVSDFFGEKLNEDFVAGACRNVFAACGLAPAFHMLTFDGDSYALLLDCEGADYDRIARMLEDELEQNYHYCTCIRLGQLKPALCIPAPSGASRYISFCQGKGIRLGDIKFREIDTSFKKEHLV